MNKSPVPVITRGRRIDGSPTSSAESGRQHVIALLLVPLSIRAGSSRGRNSAEDLIDGRGDIFWLPTGREGVKILICWSCQMLTKRNCLITEFTYLKKSPALIAVPPPRIHPEMSCTSVQAMPVESTHTWLQRPGTSKRVNWFSTVHSGPRRPPCSQVDGGPRSMRSTFLPVSLRRSAAGNC